MYGKGIADNCRFIELAHSTIRESMEEDKQALGCQKLSAPTSSALSFAKALNVGCDRSSARVR